MGRAQRLKMTKRVNALEIQLATVLLIIEPLFELLDEGQRKTVMASLSALQDQMRG